MRMLRTQLGGSNLPCRGQEAPQRALIGFSPVRAVFVNQGTTHYFSQNATRRSG
jgi:hypothetical protein